MLFAASVGRARGIHVVLILLILVASPGCRKSATDGTRQSDQKDQTTENQTVNMTASGASIVRHHAPHNVSTPGTLFESIDAESIGITFRHLWKPRNRYEAMLLKTGFTGGGVCMGDYDGDGLCDVYFTRPHGGGQLFRNKGGFRFEDVTKTTGVASESVWSTGATFVDIDNDSDLDLCVSAYDSANILFLNNGDGTFKKADHSDLNFRGASIKTIFADYDNDGDLDAYLVTNRLEPKRPVKIRYLGSPGHYRVAPEHQELAMAINLPSGEQKFAKAGQFDRLFKNMLKESGRLDFKDVTREAGLTGNFHGLDATWWDYDHDGDPDIYVANDFTDPDQWLRNNGDGTFTDITKETVPNTPWFAMGSAFGDLNKDGLLDLIATDMSGTTHYREKMAMGSMDAVSWFLDTAEPRQYMRNALYVNTGTNRFLELAHLAGLSSSDWTWSVKIADLDNDGLEDVYATNGFTRDYLNSDFNEQLKKRGRANDSMAWYDAPELKEKNIAFRNEGDLHFGKTSHEWGLDELSICFGAAFGDLDNDGDIDLITNNFDGPPTVYRNRSSHHRLTVQLVGTQSNRMGVGAFVTATIGGEKAIRYVQHENGYMSSNQPIVHFGMGDAEIVSSLDVHWPSGIRQRVTGVTADQHIVLREPTESIEVASTEQSDKQSRHFQRSEIATIRHKERPFDDFLSQPLLPNRLSQYGPGIAVSDVNQDGRPDLFLAGAAGSAGQLFLQTKEGTFELFLSDVFEQHQECEDMGALFVDIDNDQDLDLYVVSGGIEVDSAESELLRDRVYVNSLAQTGQFDLAHAPSSLAGVSSVTSGSSVVATDFDRDGDVDLFVGGRCVPHAYPTTPVSQLLRNDNGTFTDCASDFDRLAEPGMVTSAVWSDIDNDGWPDLLVTCEYGPICVFRNKQGHLVDATADSGTSKLLGWWNSIVPADVDCDGDMDYAVGNLGFNTKYHPSFDKPQYIFYGDFSGDGRKHIVEAKPGSDGLLPVRGRSCSSNAMPHLREKFNTFHQFATSSLSDIYSDECLQESLRLQANIATSGILLNDGNGRFEFHPFPRLAQAAPVFGIRVVYVNDDPFPDLLLAQNFYGPQRETGRMNGGLGCLLVNQGDGNFEFVRADQSGIVVPEDAKGLVSIDVNGDRQLDHVISVNNGPVIALTRQTTSRLFTIRFDNKVSRYSRMKINYRDGQKQLIDLTNGDGYLSQSNPGSIQIGYAEANPPTDCELLSTDGATATRPVLDPQEVLIISD